MGVTPGKQLSRSSKWQQQHAGDDLACTPPARRARRGARAAGQPLDTRRQHAAAGVSSYSLPRPC